MVTTDIHFNGNVYTCRIVKDNEGSDLIIGGLNLLDALHPGESGAALDGFANGKAQHIDNEIFYYTADCDLALTDEELIEVLKESNPDWF